MINLIPFKTNSEEFKVAIYLLEKYAKNYPDGKACVVSFFEDTKLPGDAYRVEVKDDSILVYGNTSVSFNAAVGHLVRHQDDSIKSQTVTFNSDFRSVYFANHFYNYYHAAPVEEVCEYIETLALWGQSVLCLWFDMHHFESISSPEASAMLDKMKTLFKKAKSLGMKTSLTRLANEYYVGADKSALAENSADDGRYKFKLSGYYYTELCPSVKAGENLILSSLDEIMESLSSVGLDYIQLWPYDQGGCTCDKCYPWGSNGFYKISKKSARVVKKHFPDAKIILSCWRFGTFTDGEWEGILPLLKEDGDWIDMLMVDIDAYIPDELHSLNKPIVSFPEISMYHATPWGGYGANPFPKALSKQFIETNSFCRGGSLYSEGIFEDINKAFALELMRNPYVDPKQTAYEYCGYHFGYEYAEALADILMRLEETLDRKTYRADGSPSDYPVGEVRELHRYHIYNSDNVEEIYKDFKAIDENIPPEIKEDHRYKSIYARVCGDMALLKNGGFPSDESDEIYIPLAKAYHAEKAYYFVSPITRESILANRGEGI